MNAKDAWLATLGQLQIQLNRSTYDTWLRHAELLGHEDGRFVVTVPHAYAKDWIERHLLDSMTRILSGIYRHECEIQIIVWDPIEEEPDDIPLLIQPEPAYSDMLSRLNPSLTFENFIIGQANNYAALLGRAIVDSPAGKYSPVLFCGDMGLGKTHLLQAITRSLIERGQNAVYVTAEDFTTELVAAIRNKENFDFREKYRTADAVLIDDIQFIEGKTSTQNEIVAVWDTLRNRQKTIVFASDRLPADMGKISKDARSRLQAGPIAMIDTPDPQMRRDLLDAYSRRRGFQLAPEVRELIASRPDMSARDLEAAVEQLTTYAQLTGNIVTDVVAQALLHIRGAMDVPATSYNRGSNSTGSRMYSPVHNSLHSTRSSGALKLDTVLEATASYYHLTVVDLASRQRTKIIALARQLAMYLAREDTDASLIQIGEALGGRDHSTVLHGHARITELLESDNEMMRDVAAIRQMMGVQTPR